MQETPTDFRLKYSANKLALDKNIATRTHIEGDYFTLAYCDILM